MDEKMVGDATYGLSREDIYEEYADYNNHNSGYEYLLNTMEFSNGSHKLSVKEINSAGQENETEIQIQINNSAQVSTSDQSTDMTQVLNQETSNLSTHSTEINNITKGQIKTTNLDSKLPVIGNIERPNDGEKVDQDVILHGWYLDSSGVSNIKVYVDNEYVGEAKKGIERYDVGSAFPDYSDNNSGFEYILNTRLYKNGIHTIKIIESGKDGNTGQINKTIDIQNLQAKGYIEKPHDEAIQDSASIQGWYLDGSGVNKIEAYLDGWYAGAAYYGIQRSDVLNAYKEYENDHSGFQYTLNTKLYTNGYHTLSFKEYSTNGETSEISKTINIQNLPAMGYVESPKDGEEIRNNANIQGWYLDGSGVDKIEAYLDGWYAGAAYYGIQRGDVFNAYQAYNDEYSGFQYTLNTKLYSNGIHNLTFKEIALNGKTSEITSKVNINNLPAIGTIETPKPDQIVQGITKISGWYLDGSPVSKLEILIDGSVTGTANYGMQRGDVANVFPMYETWNSGYEYYLDTSALSGGAHTITVKETAINGHTNSSSIIIYISKFENGALKKGIDVSHYQYDKKNPIDFNAVRDSGVSFVIAKATEGSESGSAIIDSTFKRSIEAASEAGLQTNAYHMFRGVSEEDAREEARWFLKNIKDVPISGYLFVDVEYSWLNGNAKELTGYVNAFLDELYNAGYYKLGIYTNYSFMNDRLIESDLRPGILKWIARYNDTLGRSADIWQNTSSGRVPGIDGNVDVDYSYSILF